MLASSIQESRAYWEIKAEGKAEVLVNMLNRRLGIEISADLKQRLEKMTNDRLDALSDVFLEFKQLEDLMIWLDSPS